jgi:iron uptake system component EfeO
MTRPLRSACTLVALLGTTTFVAACTNPDLDGDPKDAAIVVVKDYVAGELDALHAASVALQQAAPVADALGWNAVDDAAAVDAMKAAWRDARAAYEHVEGAVAVLFPDLDRSTDERYDGFLAAGPDDDLFDDDGVIGVHAVERILWSDAIPAHVVAFEQALPHYRPAAFPVDAAQARSFADALVGRLVDDTATMRDAFAPLALAPETAYRGVLGSLLEQHEKVGLAGSGEDESRYAAVTLADMRHNLQGGLAIFAAFAPALDDVGVDGRATRARIEAGFDRAFDLLSSIDGDAIPLPPSSWNAAAPSDADLQTDYGRLFSFFAQETNVDDDDSFVAAFAAGADLLGIPRLPE